MARLADYIGQEVYEEFRAFWQENIARETNYGSSLAFILDKAEEKGVIQKTDVRDNATNISWWVSFLNKYLQNEGNLFDLDNKKRAQVGKGGVKDYIRFLCSRDKIVIMDGILDAVRRSEVFTLEMVDGKAVNLFKGRKLNSKIMMDFLNYLKSEHNKNSGTYEGYDHNLLLGLNALETPIDTFLGEDLTKQKEWLEDNETSVNKLRSSSYKAAVNAYKNYLEWRTENPTVILTDDSVKTEDEGLPANVWKFPLNQILYGPPGTGKTHNSVIYAYAICEGGDVEQLKETCKKKEEYDKVFKKYKELQKQGRIEFITFHQSYGYEEFIRGIKPIVIGKDDNRKVVYEVEDGIFKKFCDEAKKETNQGKNYVFIIDEINRGNVSKIFGELITLIEESKRIGKEEEATVKLPYEKDKDDEPFGVPQNVYILGTMNTADRSLVQLDAALRRRFRFEEMMPEPELLKPVDGVELKKLLSDINERICALIDREHQIGHSYLMKVKTLQDLQETFQYEIIPLLQEYFYEDYESILKVLNNQLIQVASKKFGGVDYKTYTINAKGANPKDFKAIYGGDTSDTENAENTEPQE